MKRLVLAVIAILLIACTPTATPAPTVAPAPATARPPATPTSALAATATQIPQPTSIGTPTVGQRIIFPTGLTFTVEKVEKEPGLLFITVLLDNSKGTKDVSVSSIASFSLKDQDGNVADFTLSLAKKDTTAPNGKILMGDKLRGVLSYKTDKLTSEPSLYYQAELTATPLKIALR